MVAKRSRSFFIAAVCLLLTSAASAQVMPQNRTDSLHHLSTSDARINPQPQSELINTVESLVGQEQQEGWSRFTVEASGEWVGYVDERSGLVDYAEGSGIAWIPGRGNHLTAGEVTQLGGKAKPTLSDMESIARDFLPQVAGMMGVDPKELVLNQGRSGNPADYLWYVDFDVQRDGMIIDGARVVFRVNHGNLIQFGTEKLPSPKAATPALNIDRDKAYELLADYVGGFQRNDELIDKGTLRLLPVGVEDGRFNDGYEFGNGRGLMAVWDFSFHRYGEMGTWRGRVDATTGEIVEFGDINEYAQVTGGAYANSAATGSELVLPMPYANVSSGGYTNSAGVYTYGGGTVTSTLQGQYVRISDSCGSISKAADGSGNIAFGTSSGTNCTTPGSGGSGNTHSSRMQFYHLNRAKEVARGWLPSNSWLNAQLNANVNLNQTCNAYWLSPNVNFFRSGGGCGNTGEIASVSLHEYGHGLDANDGNGSSPDRGTGETYGDFTAALATHNSCIGPGFLGSNCGGYGDACTSCTGVRDIDYAKHSSGVPHTVSNFTQTKCPTSSSYKGPCGREGHCESYVSSEALWDLANRDMPNPGSGSAWTAVDRLWYLSRSTSTGAFSCTASGTWSSNGCSTGNYWKTFRAADDDDGNLSNGTPHSGALYAAFNRHGIACTTDSGANTTFRGCTQPSTPTVSLTAGNNSATVSWTSSGSGVVYDIFRSELGCNAGFTKIANDATGTSFADNAVANGYTYSYQVVAHPSGTEACGSSPSTCQSVTPVAGTCTPPSAPTGLSATAISSSQINLSWSAVSGATSYTIYRSTTSGGPYSSVGTSSTTSFSNTGLSASTTYYYVVTAFAGCESSNSSQASATTMAGGGGSCTTSTLYTNGFESGSGLNGWTKGSFNGGSTTSWRGTQTCTAQTGTKIFRYGGSGCTGNYSSNNFNFARPPAISVPSGSSTTRLAFGHRFRYETGYDGGTLTLSLDGSNYYYIDGSAIISGGYNGTAAADCAPSGAAGASIWTGVQTSFSNATVNLDAACDAISGGSGGCAGQTLYIGFTSITDCSATDDGWFLDNVTVTACTP